MKEQTQNSVVDAARVLVSELENGKNQVSRTDLIRVLQSLADELEEPTVP